MYNCQDLEKNVIKHCRCCGARLPKDKNEYCNAKCRAAGQKLWRKEQRRRQKWLSDSIGKMAITVDEYNRANHTSYSYGQFVATILPKLIKGVHNNDEF